MAGTWLARLVLAWGLLVILSGCAGKLPPSVPLSPGQQEEADGLLTAFIQTPPPPGLDADIRLGWDMLASKGTIEASLQVQPPAFLRFTATDPLGRALFIIVSDGTTFTMVDSRVGRVYQGRTASKFWHSQVPEALRAEDLFFFLSGSLPDKERPLVNIGQNPERTGYWYVWQDGRNLSHHILVDRQQRRMVRHLLVDPQGDLVVEVRYLGYGEDRAAGYNWPRHLEITGKAVTGTLSVQVEKIYPNPPLPVAFELAYPSHYTVEQVP